MAKTWRQVIKRKVLFPLKAIVKPIFRDHVYVVKHGFIKGMKLNGNLGFLRPRYMTDKERFLMNLEFSGKTVYDIGAHIGITTLFFSRAVGDKGQVISFEPNPEAFGTLHRNVDLNGLTNVRLFNVALGAKRDTLGLVLVFGDSSSALATLDMSRQAELLKYKGRIRTRILPVEVYPLDEYILANSLPDPDFVKIDVEGYEYSVLLGAQGTLLGRKPPLLLEMHGKGPGQRSENRSRIIELLSPIDYSIQDIVSGGKLTKSNIQQTHARHLFCS